LRDLWKEAGSGKHHQPLAPSHAPDEGSQHSAGSRIRWRKTSMDQCMHTVHQIRPGDKGRLADAP